MTGLPYTYTEQVNHFTATVELRFVIKNTTGTAVGPAVPVLEKPERAYTKLEGVKDTDTMGVHVDGDVLYSKPSFSSKPIMRLAVKY